MSELLIPSDTSEDLEVARQRVVEMIGRQHDPEDVLTFLCRQALFEEEGRVAFFLFRSDQWKPVAQDQRDLAGIIPDQLSHDLLEASQAGTCGVSFCHGWARHLYSGIGELLGIFVLLGQRPLDPDPLTCIRIDSVCGLATLAIEQRNLLDELSYKADHDPITGLYNRICFERKLALRLASGRAGLALLHVDLDRFHLVNDVIGQPIGNYLLRQVGLRFRSCLRPGEIVARAGGDEFTLLLSGCGAGPARERAEQVMESLHEPFALEGHELCITATIGIGCQDPRSTPDSIQREAYIALYHAKRAGKSRAVVFDSSMAATPPERLEMERRLRSALANAEMLLHYQPQVDLVSGQLVGAEALLRWKPPDLGIISPTSFVPILEETGMIIEFGYWVLLEACRQGKRWLDTLGNCPRLAVNVSPLQFAGDGFVKEVEKVLAETGFPPHLLELELTESMLIVDYTSARAIAHKLQRAGVTLALDDFGMGHSSLARLHEIPLERLKIDRAFVSSIGEKDDCPAIVDNMIRTGRSLRMATIAEGIETAHQAEVLRASQCDAGQGYFFSPPLGVREFEHWLDKRRLAA